MFMIMNIHVLIISDALWSSGVVRVLDCGAEGHRFGPSSGHRLESSHCQPYGTGT